MKKPLRSKPPGGNLNDFISGAGQEKVEKTHPVQKTEEVYPWEESGVREDVTKTYNLRLPEPYLLKLKYIAENTPESMQSFCLKVILPGIDKKIDDLLHR